MVFYFWVGDGWRDDAVGAVKCHLCYMGEFVSRCTAIGCRFSGFSAAELFIVERGITYLNIDCEDAFNMDEKGTVFIKLCARAWYLQNCTAF